MDVLESHHAAHRHFWQPHFKPESRQAWHDRLSWVAAAAVIALLVGYHAYIILGT